MYVYGIVYLSNHVNHLFIIYQKIIMMAIIFKINMWVFVFTLTYVSIEIALFPVLLSVLYV